MSTRLYGRDTVLHDLVPRLVGLHHQQLKTVSQEHHDDPPAVLLAGAHGSGRTAVLEALRQAYRARVPVALVDCADTGGEDETPLANTSPAAEILTGIACGLGGRRAGYGRLRFPRLLAGLIVISSWHRAEAEEEARTRARVERLLLACEEEKDPVRAGKWTADVTERIATWGNDDLGPVARAGAGLFLDRYLSPREGKAVRRWYHQRGGADDEDGEAALVSLCRYFHLGDDLRDRAEATLVAALLEDLRAEYKGWRKLNRAPRPLLLLDNVHTPAGAGVLGALLAQRARAEERADPLVVVATALGDARREEYGDATVRSLAEVASRSGWRRTVAGSPSAGLLALELPALGREDLLPMLAIGGLPPRPELLRAVHRFTGGRALGCGLLRDAIEAAPAPHAVKPHQLAELTHRDEPVTERMLGQLVPDPLLRQQLVLLSLAQDIAAARALAAAYLTRDQERGAVDAVRSYLRAEQWPEADRPFVADPFLRAVLVHELRRGPAAATDPPRTWEALHGLLRRHHEAQGQTATAQHHALAGGDAAQAARWLADTFLRDRAQDWLSDLWYIATAPHPPLPGWAEECRATAAGERDGQLAGDSVQRSVNRLLHTLWYVADPLTVPDTQVCGRLGRELDFLSLKHPVGNSTLYDASREWPTAVKDLKQPATAPTE